MIIGYRLIFRSIEAVLETDILWKACTQGRYEPRRNWNTQSSWAAWLSSAPGAQLTAPRCSPGEVGLPTWRGGTQGATSLSQFVRGSGLALLVVAEVILGHPNAHEFPCLNVRQVYTFLMAWPPSVSLPSTSLPSVRAHAGSEQLCSKFQMGNGENGKNSLHPKGNAA